MGVDGAERLAELAEEKGVAFVDAPVLGTRKPAEEAKLVVLASGPDDALDRCEPVFDVIGQAMRRLGPVPNGSKLKMVTNLWLLAVTEGAAEAIALAEGLDLDPREFLATMEGSQIDTPYLHLKGEAMLERKLEPSFKLKLAEKDASLVLEAADRAGAETGSRARCARPSSAASSSATATRTWPPSTLPPAAPRIREFTDAAHRGDP